MKRLFTPLLAPWLASLLVVAAPVQAQDFPNRPIHIVIPYAPGGGSDILGRPVAPLMAERLKQSVVIDNKGGAGGNIGAQQVATSAPDGYTLLLANNSHAINPFMYKAPGFDLAADFTPITLLGTSPALVVAHKSVPFNTLQEMVVWSRNNPGKLNFASAGTGTPGHMANLLFNKQAKLNALHVPYKGTGPATLALLQKEVDIFFGTPAAVEPHVKSGNFKALAVTSKTRFASFPTVPTVAESGIPELADFNIEIWWGLLAPAKTPAAVLDKLHDAAVRAVADPKTRENWIAKGMVPTTTSRAEFQALLRAELKRWEQIVKENNITAD